MKQKGVAVPYTDILISVSALQEKALLLHADAHFDAIARHAGIKVESLVEVVK